MSASPILLRIRYLILLLPAVSGFEVAASQGDLIVHFIGMQNNQGSIVCSLVESREHYLSQNHQPKRNCQVRINANKASWTVKDLPFGHYAITAYHDVNGNGELDTGLFRIPTEDFGFSNNAQGIFGPPDYDAAVFEFSESGQAITIRIE